MADKILKKSDLGRFLGSLAGLYQVLAPAPAGGRYKMQPAGEDYQLDFAAYRNTFLSPKDLFFPQSERMFEFTADPSREGAFLLRDVNLDPPARLVFGLRPCDAKAFYVLDRIFTNDQFSDPYWQNKREATVLIGLACNEPGPTCFCSSVNSGPFHPDGLDALAVDLGETLLFKPLTEKGIKALAAAQGLGDPKHKEDERAFALQAAAEAAIGREAPTGNIFRRSVMELFDAAHWDRWFESCINCGVCTFVCPTCHCFDIQDEVAGADGDRVRNWDTCMSWLFTFHGSGHNPRPGKKERVRQRFMHKFKYIPLKRGGELGCVGCGRCVNLCPVNIDVRDVVRDMNA
ncbi:MAG: 4Fe-4S dicluster domain-containing protein [Thermodesulfobacteriota bacterium]